VNKYLEKVTNNGVGGGGGLLELYCGFGKTICALNICSRLKQKTLIIVHKEFLLNQWVERIEQFLPSVKVGRIQGQTIDIEGKDIVIGMLQSLSMKDYASTVFDSFGLTIVDEVHHISSQVFSCVLFKIVTKYMLGLSATMNRKDGTTNVIKMFLGDVVYKSVREDEFNVAVRAVYYTTEDPLFNEIVYNYRGEVQYSSMITKLCAYIPRSEFILFILKQLLAETWNTNQQIMILAHNKSLLTYLYDSIVERKLATVGYYVGGMKEAALKESESKQVIIATYSMAAEALDIKTLTSLIMATPKTDIEQSVGRILREKSGHKMIIDIIDSHTPFRNQWAKRRSFYNKQKYKIIMSRDKLTDMNISQCKTEDHDGVEEAAESSNANILNKKCLIQIDFGIDT
jgi:superfamily II DNA or RNA helicase